MVTLAQIDRIASRCDAVAEKLAPRPEVVVITAWYGHEDEACAQHFEKFPLDRRAKLIIVVRKFREQDCIPPEEIRAAMIDEAHRGTVALSKSEG